MCPFTGEGELAMLDGLELGIVLAEAVLSGEFEDELEEALATWEMFDTAGQAPGVSKANIDAFISEEGS